MRNYEEASVATLLFTYLVLFVRDMDCEFVTLCLRLFGYGVWIFITSLTQLKDVLLVILIQFGSGFIEEKVLKIKLWNQVYTTRLMGTEVAERSHYRDLNLCSFVH